MKRLIVALVLAFPVIASADPVRRNENQTTIYATDGDIGPHVGVDRYGNQIMSLNAGTAAATNPIKLEDVAAVSGDAGVGVFGVLRSALVAPAAVGDYSNLQQDESGRLITSLAPAGETWQSGCGTATATTADVAIKGAVASNRIYVTSITCSNTSATVATNLNFKDGTTVMAVGGVSQMATASGGFFTAYFNPPLRGTVNTAFNFNTGVSTTSVICCANGYISVN